MALRSLGGRLIRWLIILTAGCLILFAAYTWLMLTWSYSLGERAGYVQKISKKGWVVKTWEGELAMVPVPGAAPEKFYFSVRDEAVADSINATLGRQVALSYEQHVGLPTSLFGETEYFIVRVRRIQ